MSVVAMLAAATSAQAASGGISSTRSSAEEEPSSTSCERAHFGRRTLRLNDCGRDVKTLNWILKSKPFEAGVRGNRSFDRPTKRTVRRFQRRNGTRATGVVNRRTARKLRRSMRRDFATWYGPGFFGNRTACGQRLTRRTVGVAHKRLPCGTPVVINYRGRFLRTRVIDRGPYAHGASWDLTQRAARWLGFEYSDHVRAAVVR